MRLHVVGLPHTQTIRSYSPCAYTEKVRKFCGMMRPLGYEVTLYAGERNEADVDEHVVCITAEEQQGLCGVSGPEEILSFGFNPDDLGWRVMNGRAIAAIRERLEPRDVICLIAGRCQAEIADAFPDALFVEFGVGYGGTFSRFRAFESYAWMHFVYGRQAGSDAVQGRFYDRVIPNFFELEQFPFRPDPDGYLAFVGRLNEDKGIGIAAQVAEATGMPLVVAGQGPIIPGGCDYRGLVGPEERAKILSGATAVLVPSLYLEPFGGVAVEAMLCGTPAITTDWGAFPETVPNGIGGYRCRTLQDFVDAVDHVGKLDRHRVREHALRYSTPVVAREYDRWFQDLDGLWGNGWATLAP